jgi:hypothetical protein
MNIAISITHRTVSALISIIHIIKTTLTASIITTTASPTTILLLVMITTINIHRNRITLVTILITSIISTRFNVYSLIHIMATTSVLRYKDKDHPLLTNFNPITTITSTHVPWLIIHSPTDTLMGTITDMDSMDIMDMGML